MLDLVCARPGLHLLYLTEDVQVLRSERFFGKYGNIKKVRLCFERR